MQRGIGHGLRCHLLVSRDFARELVAVSGRQSPGCFMGLWAMTPIVGVRALCQARWPFRRVPSRGSHPIVGGIVQASSRSVFGQWVSYPLPPWCGVVSSMWHGTGMASDRAEVTAVLSVLAWSVGYACSCQSRHA
jgi:hypothetical protein